MNVHTTEPELQLYAGVSRGMCLGAEYRSRTVSTFALRT